MRTQVLLQHTQTKQNPMKASHPKALEDQATQIIDSRTILPNSNQLRIAIEQPWQP
jgi:hypothetical protein